ncbi:MAG: zinc carboxypeptidase [Proteobacteria bacterium]|nr:zinc carboxypeptidase [Pseudomonadota bacterium]
MNPASTNRLIRSLFLLTVAASTHAADLRVSTDFEGGSAKVESIDQAARVIRFMPDGNPQRGWSCWWYLRVDGVAKDERLTLDLAASDRPTRNNGQDTSKPLASIWAMPARATFSTDGKTWQHTAPGKKQDARILYEVTGTGGPLWIAWGPPFTPRDTDALLAEVEKQLPAAKSFELARTREGRPVRGLRVSEATTPNPPGIWVHARQHAWESGSCWVARGFTEWLAGDDADAKWLRTHAEVFVVPIMDVDNAATGNGGKEANPRDHNRDWDDHPVYPEVAAAQQRLRTLVKENRLAVFLDLHNPGPGDPTFFFVLEPQFLKEPMIAQCNRFVELAYGRISKIKPLIPMSNRPKTTGASYHPLWRNMSANWVCVNGNPDTVSLCLETIWNYENSTTTGYRAVGQHLGRATADYLRERASAVPRP